MKTPMTAGMRNVSTPDLSYSMARAMPMAPTMCSSDLENSWQHFMQF
jgi:hypothetical protein